MIETKMTRVLKVTCLLIMISATRLDAAPKLTDHSFLLAKGKATLAALGGSHHSLGMINIKSVLQACINRSYDPLPVAYVLMDEARLSTFSSNGFARVVSNIYRAVKAVDRAHNKEYAYDFLELAAEIDKLDLDLLYRNTQWLSVVDIVLPSYFVDRSQRARLDLTDDIKLHFYEQSDTVAMTEKSSTFVDKEELFRFLRVKQNNKDLVKNGVVQDLGRTIKKIKAHFHFVPEEEKVFDQLVSSLKAYSDKNKKKQSGQLSSSDTAERRSALASILEQDPNKSMVRHEATLSKFVTNDFVQGRKPLRMRSLSRLYSLVEMFRGNGEVYHELRWQYLTIYKHSLNLSKKKSSKKDLTPDDELSSSEGDSHQAQFVDDSSLYVDDGAGLLTDEQLGDLRNPMRRLEEGLIYAREHPSFAQIKRHSYFEHIVDALVDKRLHEFGSSYTSAREYIIKHGISTLGLNAKQRNAYIYEGHISEVSVAFLREKLSDLVLTVEQSEALEHIAQAASKDMAAVNITVTTIMLVEDVIKIANRVYNESTDKSSLFSLIKVFSALKREVTAGRIEKDTYLKASEALIDLRSKTTSDDDEKVLTQLLRIL